MTTTESNDDIVRQIAALCALPVAGVHRTVRLLREGATVPFLSRYRKEATGGLDEVQIGAIREQMERLDELEKRKRTILSTIREQGRLTDELRLRIERCYDSARLEDLYLPYKPKRKTRAAAAREKGLEPLAALLMRQEAVPVASLVRRFAAGGPEDERQALQGACDIMAEWIAEDERMRESVRRAYDREGVVASRVVKGREDEGVKYSDYFDMREPLRRVPSHRFLAMARGEREGFLRLSVAPADAGAVLERLRRRVVRRDSPARPYVEAAAADAYKRLIAPSMENEAVAKARQKADDEAIRIFADNLRQLLLSAPLGPRRVLAIDPGFRTGCKVACLDERGDLLHHETIYPHPPQRRQEEAAGRLVSMIRRYGIEAVAIGDGTAGRETERLVRSLGQDVPVRIFMVSEDGASVYSASEAGREEFPDYDVTVRGAISIGRRLIDPLSELVKIDPESIGVGQYQHDVDRGKLRRSLDAVVASCVNRVGVNLNTASARLLSYVSGLGPALAREIVACRSTRGGFRSRRELTEVPRLGARTFEQCAGFLRIPGAENPLDASAVHPESYGIVEAMARDLGVRPADLLERADLRKRIDPARYVSDRAGMPTLLDIMAELERPGLDPRGEAEAFEFADVHSVDDLREGMILPGIVTNLTAFGAFVDIGVKQDGLVHISRLADHYVSSPSEAVSLHQRVRVRVMEIDRVRGRIGLSMRDVPR